MTSTEPTPDGGRNAELRMQNASREFRGPVWPARPPRPVLHSAFCILHVFAFALAAPAMAQVDTATVVVTAVAESTLVTMRGGVVLAGQIAEVFDDEQMAVAVTREDKPGAAAFYIPEFAVTIVASGASFALKIADDHSSFDIFWSRDDTSWGWIDVYHNQSDPAVRVVINGAEVGLKRGAVRVGRASQTGDLEVLAGAGQAFVVTQTGDAATLSAGAENQLFISTDGRLSAPVRRENAPTEMANSRAEIVQLSLVPDFARIAESVAEGDIAPPTRGSRVPAVAVAPSVRIREIVPRGGVVTRATAVSVAGSFTRGAQSTAEQFIGQRTVGVALAVVGARFERTRVTGATGVRPPLAINVEVRPRFLLGRGGVFRPGAR